MQLKPERGCIAIAVGLEKQTFPSRAVVEVDSILVTGLYGQLPRKPNPRSHEMQTLATEFKLDNVSKNIVYSAFEKGKNALTFEKPDQYMALTRKMAAEMYRECPMLKKVGSECLDVLHWCIAAYAMVVNPESTVKLSVIELGATKGFAIEAKGAIKEGQRIYELAGLMPIDNRAKHSDLSSIKPNPTQNQSPRVERVLFGPIRFVNHVCEIPNAEYIAITGTSAFTVAALRDIASGEQILVDYGKGWFSGEVGGCPCIKCKPNQSTGKRKKLEEDEAEADIEAKKKEARRTKQRQKTQNKRKGFVGDVGSSKV